MGASPGPGVAGNGLSAKNDSQFRGRHSNPCPGDPFRGHCSFLQVAPKKVANVDVYVCCFLPSKSFSNTWKMAANWAPRARIVVSTPELAIVFRGVSVSGHPGARGGQQQINVAPTSFQKNKQNAILKHVYVYVVCFSPAANSRACGHGRMRSAPGPGALGGPPGGKTWEKGNKKKNKKGNIER